jgi:hypothetical protein
MMSFWDRFESTRDGVEDTIEFTIRTAVVTLACVILVVVIAMVVGLFMPKEVVDSDKVFEIIGPAFNTVVGAFVGLLGGLSLNANARDKETPPEAPLDLTPDDLYRPDQSGAVAVGAGGFGTVTTAEPEVANEDDDDDDMAPWEKHRHDLRWDANGDGVVDENDFPDWRNPGA